MEGTESIESQIFMEVMGTSMPSLILYTIDVVLFFLAIALGGMSSWTIFSVCSAQPAWR